MAATTLTGIIPIVVGGFSLLLNIIGLAIPYWLYGDYSVSLGVGSVTVTYNAGLWRICLDDTCNDLPDNSINDTLKAVRAMELLGMLFLMSGLGCAILKLLVMKKQDILSMVAGACALVAGACMIIGCIVFAEKYRDDFSILHTFDLHAGFALCIVAGVGSIVAGVLFFVLKSDSKTVDVV